MKLRWFSVALSLVTVLGFGCSEVSESVPSQPGLDTLRSALLERDELERTYLLTSFLRTMRPEDVVPALEMIDEHRVGIDADEVRLFMFGWTRFDGPGAFATARDWPTPWSSVLMKGVMHAWGFNDGRAARAAWEQIEDEELRESLQMELLGGWVASHDRVGASEFAATVSKPRLRTRLALRLAGEAMRDGPDAVIAWADAVPVDAPNDFKKAVFGRAAGVLARLDPERVKPWYEGQMRHLYTRTGLSGIAAQWAQYHDVDALIEWIEGLRIAEARESERTDAIREAFRIWAVEAPVEAVAWLESASPGPLRDAAIDQSVRAMAETSPAEALRWIGQIVDDDLRRKRTLKYTRRWYAQDRDAASAWIAQADIPDGWRHQIRRNLPREKPRGGAKGAKPDA